MRGDDFRPSPDETGCAAEFGTAVVILGMHRSGTSAVTRVLGCCGLKLPQTLISPAPDNERGFWESKPIKTLNEDVLSYLGQSWHTLDVISDSSFDDDWMDHHRGLAEGILKNEFDSGSDFVLKDPRLCRLVPLWQDMLHKVARRVVFINVVRAPAEVAQSLLARNGLPLHHGMVLWARYSLDAEWWTRGQARAFVNFAEFLQDWRSTVERLAKTFGLPLSASSNREEVDQYLSPELRHHFISNDAEPLISAVRETYDVLRRWGRSESETETDYLRLDAARAQLDDFAGVLSCIFEEARQHREMISEVSGRIQDAAVRLEAAQRAVEQNGATSEDVQRAQVCGEAPHPQLRSELAAVEADLGTARKHLTRAAVAGGWSPRDWIAWLHGRRLAPTDIGAFMEVTKIETGVTAPNDGAMRTGIVRRLLSGFPPRQRVVDLGAGPCIFARIARDAGHEVTAVDARTVRKPPDEELGSIKFVHFDVREFDVSGFDIVLFLGLLYHFDIDDQVGMLRKCNHTTVILDCEVHVTELVQGTPKEWQTTIIQEGDYEGVRYPEDDNPMASVGNKTSFWHTEPSMRRLFENSGFRRLAIVDPLFTSKYGGRRFYVAS